MTDPQVPFAFRDDSSGSLPEAEYDNLNLSFDSCDYSMENIDKDDFDAGKNKLKNENYDKGTPTCSEYILGTLIVRVVAARKLESIETGGFGQLLILGNNLSGKGGSVNPYASVNFGGSTQRTSEVFDTLEPIWPRGETMFMDVSLPLSTLTWNDPSVYNELSSCDSFPGSTDAKVHSHSRAHTPRDSHDSLKGLHIPKPILTVAVFHASEIGRINKYPTKGVASGDSDDYFLGMSAVDLTPLLTGKTSTFDEWLPLSGTKKCQGLVRIVCEYEAADPTPRRGDFVTFTRFCHPADLYPIVPGGLYQVEQVDGDDLVLSYRSAEGWPCSFIAHRYMLVCVDRHHGAIEFCHEELASLTERLVHSPLVNTLTETVQRVPDDGLLMIGGDAMREGSSLLARWLQGGVDTAIRDVLFATNWDGRFTPEAAVSLSSNSLAEDDSQDTDGNMPDHVTSQAPNSFAVDHDKSSARPSSLKILPNMPTCPITGEPMRDPVVAGDGHTYERAAIARWLITSNKSPLTGGVLPHKELVSNYSLMSSLQEVAAATQLKNDE